MTDHSSPITPPLELLEQWWAETAHTTKDESWHVAVQAARWGADQELEACCEWLQIFADWGDLLRQDRRPQPSLKQQALDQCNDCIDPDGIIRRALETLPDD